MSITSPITLPTTRGSVERAIAAINPNSSFLNKIHSRSRFKLRGECSGGVSWHVNKWNEISRHVASHMYDSEANLSTATYDFLVSLRVELSAPAPTSFVLLFTLFHPSIGFAQKPKKPTNIDSVMFGCASHRSRGYIFFVFSY
jgi:hypothetical protein